MPVSTPSRTYATHTPSASSIKSSRYSSHPMSPQSTSSYAPTVTSTGQGTRMNVVSRIAIEGKAKQGQEGASIKMYMKLSIPVDSITPASTIALFPEENIKILTSQVHPLDSNSVPYNFSSTTSPLLHNAARALNLQARLPVTFNAAHYLSSSPSIASSSPSTSRSPELQDAATPPVDPQYTGQILVSGYHIAYVLPRYFPSQDFATLDSELDRQGHSSLRGRRLSISDRNHAHFMAAVDMWVPYLTRPPRHPYLLSIPTPRCLHNNIRLRVFPPSNTAASFASLSSLEDDANTWDLTSDPHVTRTTTKRLARSGSYNHFADDESSDSSTTGFSDGFGIQGTFPSTDRIRVRWAKPMRSFEGGTESGDTRRRVGVKDVKSEMICVVKGKSKGNGDDGAEGILMDVEYKASCKGVWFPGVATLLGMDVGLVAKNADVAWVNGSPTEWNVSGGMGYTGFNVAGAGNTSNTQQSRTSSVDSQHPHTLTPPADHLPSSLPNGTSKEGSSSNSSLLRAPLPSHNVLEYSFEGLSEETASASSHLGTLSSVSSLSRSACVVLPGAPLTLHININDVLPPNKTPFTFIIKGTILVTPRTTLARVNGIHDARPFPDYVEATEAISLPHFTVLAADAETTKIVVRNEVNGINAVVEVFSPSGDIFKDPQARKTVLQQGASTRCGEGGGRISLKLIGSPHDKIPASRLRTPNGSPESRTRLSVARPFNQISRNRITPHLIPSVKIVVTPLISRRSLIPGAYAARIHMNLPTNNQTDALEFGFARIGSDSRPPLHDNGGRHSPKVHIAGVSVAGVPVQYTTNDIERRPQNRKALEGPPFETMGGVDWASWVTIQAGVTSGENVVIDYIVTVQPVGANWLSSSGNRNQWDLLLPTFTLPVAKLEVKLKFISGLTCSLIHTNLDHELITSDSQTLLHFPPNDLFSPQVSLKFRHARRRSLLQWSWFTNGLILLFILFAVLVYRRLDLDPRWVLSSHKTGNLPNPIHTDEPVTVTVTLTTTVTESASSYQRLVTPIRFPMGSPSPTGSFLVTTLPTPTSSSSPTTIRSIHDALSQELEVSLWEKLGFNDFRATLETIDLPNLNVSSAKEALARYGKAVWEVVEYLLFS